MWKPVWKDINILKLKDFFLINLVSWLDLQLHVQSIFITTNAISSNPVHGEVYSIQHYGVKFVSDLRKQVGGFLRVLLFLPPIKRTATI